MDVAMTSSRLLPDQLAAGKLRVRITLTKMDGKDTRRDLVRYAQGHHEIVGIPLDILEIF